MRQRPAQQQRRGTITALAALLIVFLLGMVAFAVDVGWMALSQSELQHAADSAALAGANQLMSGFVQYNQPDHHPQRRPGHGPQHRPDLRGLQRCRRRRVAGAERRRRRVRLHRRQQ
jgi:hypothetical protein